MKYLILQIQTALLAALVFSPMDAEADILFNPLALPVPASEKLRGNLSDLDSKSTSAWIRRIDQNLNALQVSRRAILLDLEGRSLDQILKAASRSYIELRYVEAHKDLLQATDLIASNPPYFEISKDLEEISALGAMIEFEHQDLSSPISSEPFVDRPSFQARLPQSVSEKLRLTKQDPKTCRIKPDSQSDKVRQWIQGEPSKISEIRSRALVHRLTQGILSAHWLEVEAPNKPCKELELWRRPLLELLETSDALDLIRKTRPPLDFAEALFVALPKDQGSQLHLLRTSAASKKAGTPAQAWPPQDFSDDTSEADQLTRPFYASPWFWTILGVVGGAAIGYGIYEGTRPDKKTVIVGP